MSRSINQIAFDEGCLMKSFSQTSKINTAVSHMTKARFFWLHFYRRQYGSIIIRLPDVSRGRLKFYPWTFFFLFFLYYSTVLSSRAVDGHQMYFGDSVVAS